MATPVPTDRSENRDLEERLSEIGDAYLQRLQRGDTPDRQALLDAHPEIAWILDRHLRMVEIIHEMHRDSSSGGGPDVAWADPPRLPEQIGDCHIVRLLGAGGMGEVYLAEQNEPIHRQVALKLIKLGMDTREVVARFDTERQALAVMNHPHIAQVYEAGVSETGRPHFVMEYVPGVAVTDYCNRNRLPTRRRLELFLQLCDAVQHAHQKGVIHRDLKPSNVLVMEEDGRAVSKIIDFGVAKATDSRGLERTTYTVFGQVIGTPEYMSPEQAATDASDIDTRTDIYSLGVILYELLVGTQPFESDNLRKLPYDEICRKIREDEPPTPSVQLARRRGENVIAARDRGTDAPSLLRALRGDLDWITMKALEKDRTRRYAGASELAADILRHLNDEPVLARPVGAAYRLKKLVRKHKVSVVAGVFVALALVGGLAASLTFYVRAMAAGRREYDQRIAAEAAEAKAKDEAAAAVEARRQEAAQKEIAEEARADAEWAREASKTEAAKAIAISDFLRKMLASPDPRREGRDVMVSTVLARAADAVGTDFEDQPLVEASLHSTLGESYYALGFLDKAKPHLLKALAIHRHELGMEHRKTLVSMNKLGLLLYARGRYVASEPLLRETLEIRRRTLGDEDPDTLRTMHCLGLVCVAQGRLAEAETLYRELHAVRLRTLGEEHADTLTTMSSLAGVLTALGQVSQAESILHGVLEAQCRTIGDEHPHTLISIGNLARVLHAQGRFDDAEVLYRETLAAQRRILGVEHHDTLTSTHNLALFLADQNRPAEAEPLFRHTVRVRRQTMGEDHPATLTSMSCLARLLKKSGSLREAETLHRRALAGRRRTLGEEHLSTLASMRNLGLVLQARKKYGEAESLFRDALEIRRRTLGDEEPDTLVSKSHLARALMSQNKLEEAESLMRHVVVVASRTLPENHWRRGSFRLVHGIILGRLGRHEEAERELLEAYRILDGTRGSGHKWTRGALEALVDFYSAWDKPDRADEFARLLESPETSDKRDDPPKSEAPSHR